MKSYNGFSPAQRMAGDQIIKLMTLGLTEKEAEEQIVSGFLK